MKVTSNYYFRFYYTIAMFDCKENFSVLIWKKSQCFKEIPTVQGILLRDFSGKGKKEENEKLRVDVWMGMRNCGFTNSLLQRRRGTTEGGG